MDLAQGKGQERNANDSCLFLRKRKYTISKHCTPREMLHPRIIKIRYLYDSLLLKFTLRAKFATGTTNW